MISLVVAHPVGIPVVVDPVTLSIAANSPRPLTRPTAIPIAPGTSSSSGGAS